MHQEIKQHILEGHLKLAFTEIAVLDLSRDQRDELLKVEARYNRLQRESGQMTAEMRAIESERLNDRVLKLINWVADENQEDNQIPIVPIGPRVNDPRSEPEKDLVKSKVPAVPLLIGAGLLLILATLWASGIIIKGKSDLKKGTVGEITKTEIQKEGGEQSLKPVKGEYVRPSENLAAAKEENVPLQRAKVNTKALTNSDASEKPSIGVYYERKGAIINRDKQVAKRKARLLDSLLNDFDVNTVDASNAFLQGNTLEKIKRGELDKGKIEGLNDDFILYIQSRMTGQFPNMQFKSTYRMYRTSDGASVLEQYGSATSEDPDKGERQIVSRIIANLD